MEVVESMQKLTQEIIASYDARIASIEEIVATTYETLGDFRKRRMEMKERLRETLASEKSLRRKDFDHMVERFVEVQSKKENDVRNSIRSYVRDQKTLVKELGEMTTLRDNSNGNGHTFDLKTLRQRISEIKTRQQKQEDAISRLLRDYLKEEERISDKFSQLISNCDSLRIKDIQETMESLCCTVVSAPHSFERRSPDRLNNKEENQVCQI